MRKMTRIWITVAAIAVCLGGFQTVLWAATLAGDPETYEITLHQVRVYNQDDGAWHVAGTGDLTFDITSASSGAVVGNYISGASLPDGTYSKVEVTLSRTLLIKATVVDTGNTLTGGAGTIYYTTTVQSGGAIVCSTLIGSYALGTSVIPSSAVLPATETISGDYLIHTETLATNITVKKGESRSVLVSFNTSGSVTFENVAPGPVVACYPSAPAITITQID